MEKFFVSMMRFSTAMTLLGLDQLQNAVSSVGSGEDLTSSMDRMRETMDAFSDAVMSQVDQGKRETLDTVTRVSEDTINRAFSNLTPTFIDPREMVKTTADMMKRTSDSMVGWMGGSGAESSEGEPQKASDALGGSSRRGKAKVS